MTLRRTLRRGLALVAVVLGVLLITFGALSTRGLLAAPLESYREHLPQVIFPLVVGMWLFIGGVYYFNRR